MRPIALLAFMSVLVIGTQGASASEPDLWRPLAAVAYVHPEGAMISWVPGPLPPDYFVVYGVKDGELLPILTVPPEQFQADVASVYPAYAVGAVLNGEETEATVAATFITKCVYIYPTIPPGYAIGDCDTASPPVRPFIKVNGEAIAAGGSIPECTIAPDPPSIFVGCNDMPPVNVNRDDLP